MDKVKLSNRYGIYVQNVEQVHKGMQGEVEPGGDDLLALFTFDGMELCVRWDGSTYWRVKE